MLVQRAQRPGFGPQSSRHGGWLVHGCNPSLSEMEVKGPEFKLPSKFKASLGFKRLDSMGACHFTIPDTIIAACGGQEGVRPSVYLERMNAG